MSSNSLDVREMEGNEIQAGLELYVSLPVYAILAGISINEMEYEYCNIRLKQQFINKGNITYLRNKFLEHMDRLDTITPDEGPRFNYQYKVENWLTDSEEKFKARASKFDSIFSMVVIISMGLCFFSLTTSMSANIQDQAKEISLMRSCGMTKSSIVRLYVYESLILIISCSLCGFVIGTCIGNLMVLQLSVLESFPFILELPFY